ncbi:MAG TPA: ABC transporter permease [Rhodothermales bacterium]|nr:ABC transporter permease [Rhodothermales bacterium]
MLRNYLKVALRTLSRHRLFSFVNVVGLGLGMACCLLLLLFVRHELAFDRQVPDAERVYRVTYHATNSNDYARVPPPIAPLMPTYFNGVEAAARAFSGNVSVLVPGAETGGDDQSFEETSVYFVDSTFTDIFPLTFVQGDDSQRLAQPNTVLLNEEVAERYFGEQNPVGKTIVLEGDQVFTVRGVVEDFPEASHLHFNVLLPYDNMYDMQGEQAGAVMRQNLAQNWVISHSFTYIRLAPGVTMESVTERFAEFVSDNAPEQLQVGQSFSLTPLLDIHLHTPDIFLQPEAQGDIQYVYIFAGIAFLTLLLPCFNFVNLSTAQSIGRTREIGVRQALGAQRRQLFGQFLGESLVVSALAFLLALVLVIPGLSVMSDLTQRTLTPDLLLDPLVLLGFVGVLLLTGLLGGAYPAYLIARTDIIAALRRTTTSLGRSAWSPRKVLVALQFAISIALIGGTVLIFQQINYMTNRSLGYQPEQVVAVPLFSQSINSFFVGVDEAMRSRLDTFEETIAQHPGVLGSTLSRNAPGLGVVGRGTQLEGSDDVTFTAAMSVDYDFPEFYGMEIIAGRNFDRARGTDHQNAFIVNETAIREFGWGKAPTDALGQQLNLEGKDGEVIGVVKDFNFVSLQNPINALIMEINPAAFRTVSIRLAGGDPTETMAFLEETWNETFPEQAFNPNFLDTQLVTQYDLQARLGRLVRLFAFLGIVISCLGAYALVMYSARQRRHEIGVRKVLGASLPHILGLLYRELTILFIVGLLIATPAIYFAGTWWLENFTYRIAVNPGLILLSGFVMLALAWLTISYQSLKAARVNPVDCLRDE